MTDKDEFLLQGYYMFLEIVEDEEEGFFGWKFRYATSSRLRGWDWCPRKGGVYYFDGEVLPRFFSCIMHGYLKVCDEPDFLGDDENPQVCMTKMQFHNSHEFLDHQRAFGREAEIRLVRELTNMYGRAVYAYENQVSQPFDDHEEVLYRLSNWYVR